MYPSEAFYRDLLAVYYAIIYEKTKDPESVKKIHVIDDELVKANLDRFKFTMNFYGIRDWNETLIKNMLINALCDNNISKQSLNFVASTFRDDRIRF